MSEFLTIEDLSNRWRIPMRTVRALAQQGKIPGALKIGKHWRFREDIINRWIDEQTESKEKILMK